MKLRKIFLITSIVFVTMFLCGISINAAEVASSGTCGQYPDREAAFWTLYDNGLLVIDGMGEMEDYWGDELPWDKELVTDVVIEKGITSIGEYAFSGCSELTDISIPDGVTSIGEYAFSGCSKLTNISIPEGVETIAFGTFMDCINLKSFTVPDGTTVIQGYAFSGCKGLETIIIPGTVTSMGKRVFYDCDLKSIYAQDIESWCNISSDYGRLYSNVNLYFDNALVTDIVIPDTVSVINDYAFEGCGSLKSVEMSGSVESIGTGAFMDCPNLENINISDNIEVINSSAFYGCSGLESISIPDGVVSIESNAFSNCESLSCVELPGSVTTIKYGNFEDGALTEVHIPTLQDWLEIDFNTMNGLLSNGAKLYINGQQLKEIVVPDSITEIKNKAFHGCQGINKVVLHDNITKIGDDAFWNCDGFSEIVIPDSVTYLGERAFYNCDNLRYVTLGRGITTVKSNAFNGCPDLISVYVPSSVTNIEDSAFPGSWNTEGIRKVYIDDIKAWMNINFEGQALFGTLLYEGNNLVKEVTIPEDMTRIPFGPFTGCASVQNVILHNKVTEVSGGAFERCQNLKSINIPKGMKKIGGYAFSHCSSLESIYIPNTVTNIYSDAFYDTGSLKKVFIDDIETWLSYDLSNHWNRGTNPMSAGQAALYVNGELITELEIPDATTSINGNAFYGCSSIKKVVIPSSVVDIGKEAFSSCTALENVIFEEGVVSIGDSAFWNCNDLKYLVFPQSIDSIGNDAFQYCENIDSITFLGDISLINDNAFYQNEGLKYITFRGKCEVIEAGAFSGYGYNGENIKHIYYGGSEDEWNDIVISSSNNQRLINADKTYNITGIEGISLSEAELKLNQGNMKLLTTAFTPNIVSNKHIFWESSDSSVATVNTYGLVSAVANGEATITARSADGGFIAECTVTVSGVPGDINGDTSTNIQDVIQLLKHVNGSQQMNDISMCDLNNDGKVNIQDVIRLLKHVNNSEPLY